MKLAVYNVENLFNRARVMNQEDWTSGQRVLDAFSKLSSLLDQKSYSDSTKGKILELMEKLGLKKQDQSEWVILRRNRGALVKRKKDGTVEVTANGRADWVGSLELVEEPINHDAMLNTARVIAKIGADVLGVVEAESRPALQMFNKDILTKVGGNAYSSVMLIDGNDPRGIDVGVAVRKGYSIDYMISHVDDLGSNGKTVFSRDCPEFYVTTPQGNQILVLVNHLKSKGYGKPKESDAIRLEQAKRIREIYNERLSEGLSYIAVVGDLNDIPSSDALAPLHQNTSLKDAFLHPTFDDGGYPGTYGSCGPSNKIDYLLLSPDLFAAVTAGGVFREGMWPGVRPPKWQALQQLTRPVEAGSDHACIWIETTL